MIGDPSGRTDMRKMLTKEDIDHNAACFKKQMERFIDFGEGKAMMLNNADWLLKLNYIELLREVGALLLGSTICCGPSATSSGWKRVLSFLEFNYMIMQSYDFYYMFQHYGCNMQFGRRRPVEQYAGRHRADPPQAGQGRLCHDHHPADRLPRAKRWARTAGNASVAGTPNKTSPFDFYQYWRNVDDADVMKCIRMLTLPALWSRSMR